MTLLPIFFENNKLLTICQALFPFMKGVIIQPGSSLLCLIGIYHIRDVRDPGRLLGQCHEIPTEGIKPPPSR
jgi:hypothetical protein